MLLMTPYQVTDVAKALQSLEGILNNSSDQTHQFHVPGTSEVSQKLQLPMDALTCYLREKHGLEDSHEPTLRQFRHGQSNPTYYLAYGGEEMVLRKKPVRLCDSYGLKQ